MPDGKTLLFRSDHGADENWSFFVCGADGSGLKELTGYIDYGASPRATIYLNLAARAHAFLRHRGFVTPEDVKAIAYDVLRHRVSLTYEAEAENLTSEKVEGVRVYRIGKTGAAS